MLETRNIWDVREVAYALEVTPDSIYSYFKTKKEPLRGVTAGISTRQFKELVDSKMAGHFGSKQTKLNKTEIKDARYMINKWTGEEQGKVDAEW